VLTHRVWAPRQRKVLKVVKKELTDDRAPVWLLALVALIGLVVFVFGTFMLVNPG
jgi:hypothetical protein